MVEYGGVVRQGSGAGGGRGGGGSFDVFAALGDAVDRITSLPPEILLVGLAAILIGGLFVFRRA